MGTEREVTAQTTPASPPIVHHTKKTANQRA